MSSNHMRDDKLSITTLFMKAGAAICGVAAAVTTFALTPWNDLLPGFIGGAVFGTIVGFAVGTEEAADYKELGKMTLKGMGVGLTGFVGLAGGIAATAGYYVGMMSGSTVESIQDFVRNRQAPVSHRPSNVYEIKTKQRLEV